MLQPAQNNVLNKAPNSGRRQFLQAAAASTVALLAANPARAAEKIWTVGVIGHTGQGDYGHGMDVFWKKLPQAKMIAFADPNPAGAAKAQSRLPGAEKFSDYRKMLEVTKPDLVSICPRHVHEHADMILAATAQGVRGIYIEKPFCRTPEEADRIVAACKASGTRLAIAHRNRFHPALPVALEAVKSGAIGELLEIRGRGKEDHRGGCQDLWVLGSHVFDMARVFAGNALACSGNIYQGNRLATPADLRQGQEGIGLIAGDRLHARYEMQNGLPFYFDSIRAAGVPEANFGLQLIGNEGLIDVRIDVEPLIHYVPGNPFLPNAKPRPWIPITSAGIGKPEPIENIRPLVAEHLAAGLDLIAAINEKRPTLCNEEDGRAIVEMTYAVYASHIANGARVNLPLAARTNPFDNWSA